MTEGIRKRTKGANWKVSKTIQKEPKVSKRNQKYSKGTWETKTIQKRTNTIQKEPKKTKGSKSF